MAGQNRSLSVPAFHPVVGQKILQELDQLLQHDLLSPVRRIHQFGQMLHEGPEDPHLRLEICQYILRDASKMNFYMEGLTQFLKIAKSPLRFQAISLQEVLVMALQRSPFFPASYAQEQLQLSLPFLLQLPAAAALPTLWGDQNLSISFLFYLFDWIWQHRQEQEVPLLVSLTAELLHSLPAYARDGGEEGSPPAESVDFPCWQMVVTFKHNFAGPNAAAGIFIPFFQQDLNAVYCQYILGLQRGIMWVQAAVETAAAAADGLMHVFILWPSPAENSSSK